MFLFRTQFPLVHKKMGPRDSVLARPLWDNKGPDYNIAPLRSLYEDVEIGHPQQIIAPHFKEKQLF